MKKPLLFITTVLTTLTLFHLNTHAQERDTSKHVFQLGQVNITGTKDSL
ncbi:hypothetical protein [Mucilaginibacter lappiensis]|uniref:YceI-like domain-containing protein n=1 Tax=Mucilaginibacter lappiensis TaxID=354630 RepID=A0A841JNK5_9SPHI|nr:hypothetical protein [Mucilaginibacter lappiensis]MBB6131852.1 hypothetical protein [Mucilaginibacter lappiensis]